MPWVSIRIRICGYWSGAGWRPAAVSKDPPTVRARENRRGDKAVVDRGSQLHGGPTWTSRQKRRTSGDWSPSTRPDL